MDGTRTTRALLMFLWLFRGDTQKVEIPKKEVESISGQTALLQGWYSPSSDISRNSVVWHFTANQGTQTRESKPVISYNWGEVSHGPNDFNQRVSFAVTMPSANVSIYINHTQESDSGRYMCIVLRHGELSIDGEVHLDVKVPPSPPVCTVTGQTAVRGNVTLGCTSSQGKPLPQYKWTKMAPASEIYFPPMQNEKLGTLRLTNLTKSMAGKYVCRASNTAGSDSCSINLEVITSSYASNAGMMAAAMFGSIVGLVATVLFLILILRWCRREAEEEDEIANEIKEDAQAPKRVSWAKSNTGSDVVSKNGTVSSIATSPRPPGPHQPLFLYPYSPTSTPDTGSGSNLYQLRPGEPNPLQGLPGYNGGGVPSRKHKQPPVTNGAPPQLFQGPPVRTPNWTERAQPQVPPPLDTVVKTIGTTALMRMGGVAVMVPAQNQAGSLV
ncbi:endothelial cell-selective adhesion molecule [Genypterus blacodes]|uniref:endothelial cell-selective adhesion molecule n=1 Tax=Genypterus blacodes TaxID=154954 RepID=UPI003F76C3B4